MMIVKDLVVKIMKHLEQESRKACEGYSALRETLINKLTDWPKSEGIFSVEGKLIKYKHYDYEIVIYPQLHRPSEAINHREMYMELNFYILTPEFNTRVGENQEKQYVKLDQVLYVDNLGNIADDPSMRSPYVDTESWMVVIFKTYQIILDFAFRQ